MDFHQRRDVPHHGLHLRDDGEQHGLFRVPLCKGYPERPEQRQRLPCGIGSNRGQHLIGKRLRLRLPPQRRDGGSDRKPDSERVKHRRCLVAGHHRRASAIRSLIREPHRAIAGFPGSGDERDSHP